MEETSKTEIKRTFSDKSSVYTNETSKLVRDARPILPYCAFFIGDIRDGLPMINLQGTYLICLKNLSKQQVSILFLVLGISQFFSMAPCGYFVDYTKSKIGVLIIASGVVSLLALLIAVISNENDPSPIYIMACIQGVLTPLVHPLLQSITLGIVGSTGFTEQTTKNRTMHHLGTSLSIGSMTIIAYYIYPQLHFTFAVSPIAWIGLTYFLKKIQPRHVDRDAARGLIIKSPTLQEYEEMDEEEEQDQDNVDWADVLNMSSYKEETSSEDNESQCYYEYDRYNINFHDNNQCNTCDDSASDFTSNEGRYVPPSMHSNTTLLDTIHDSNNSHVEHTNNQSTKHTESNTNNQNENISNSNDDTNQQNQSTTRKSSILHSFFSLSSSPGQSLEEETVKAGHVRNISNAYNQVSQKLKQSKQHLYSAYQRRAVKPIKVLMNVNLCVLSLVIFLFHVSNSAVLPLVMQSLSLGDCREGMLLSGLCIFLAQFLMMIFVKIVGTYSPMYGRTKLFLFGMICLTVRCFILSILVTTEQQAHTWNDLQRIKWFILLTQLLDAAGAGTVGMLHILVTCDIAAATGRFALMLGFTNAAMCIGGVCSGYIGTVTSQKYGYIIAFRIFGLISVLPIVIFYVFMPETLPDYERMRQRSRKKIRERKKKFLYRIFSRIRRKKEGDGHVQNDVQHVHTDLESIS